MSLRPVLLIVLALVLAGGSAMLARSWLNAQRRTVVAAPVEAPEKPVRAVLVARGPLATGHILKAEDLGWRDWTIEGDGAPYILSGTKAPKDFAGSVVRQPLVTGEPITPDRVVAPGERGFLAAILKPGMRAASVAVTAISGVSGFVFPGDRVDILLTHVLPTESQEGAAMATPETQRRATETILLNTRVLAVDQKLDNKDGEAVVVRTATLEVTEKQSELLAVAAEMGRLTLSLRSLSGDEIETPADEGQPPVPSYTLDTQASHLMGLPGRSPGVKVAVLRGGKTEDTVSLFGGKKQ